MKSQNLLRVSASALMFSLLAACGGGGGEEGPENTIVKHDVFGSTFTNNVVNFLAGQSIPLSAIAETFGPKIESIVWTSDPANANSKGSLNISDAQCASAALSSRDVPGREGFFVGTARCDTSAIASNDAGGEFIISSIVKAADGSQRVEKFAVNVVPKVEPVIQKVTDFTINARIVDPVVLNQIIRLNSTITYNNADAEKPDVTYSWNVVSAPENSGTIKPGEVIATEKETGVVLTKAGTYIFALTAKMPVDGGKHISKTSYVTLVADEYPAFSSFGFKLNAKSEESTVFVGAPARLKAEYAVSPGTRIDSIDVNWSQISGPDAQVIQTGTFDLIVVPESRGSLLFAVDVEITSGAYKEKKTAFVSLAVEPVSEN